jgi:hypothetical protein
MRMLTKLNGMADRALARIVPSTEAAAGCSVLSYYEYKCVDHVKYRRHCVRDYTCYTTCYGWVSYSHC